jgi:hypothetical protein
MRVQILDTAEEDLVEGFWFYERQQPGLGVYFRNSIYADLRALEEERESPSNRLQNYHRALATRFPQNKQRSYVRSWIAAATQRGSENIRNKGSFRLYPDPTAGSSPPPICTEAVPFTA